MLGICHPLFSAQCFPSSRVDVDQELSVTISVDLNIPLEGVQAEVWLDEICGIETEPTHNFSLVSQSIASNSMVDVFSLGRDTVHTQGGQSALSMGTSVPLTGFHTSKASSDSGDGILVHNNQIRFHKSFPSRSPELRYALHSDPRSRQPRSAGISSPSVRILRHKQLKKETRSAPHFDLDQPNLRPAIVSALENPVTLTAGMNQLVFNLDTAKPGRFTISRFCLFYPLGDSRVEMVSALLEPCVHVEVLDTPPVITMSKESLYSGISGDLTFNILVGSRPISEEQITFELSKGLELITESTMASVKNYNYKEGRRPSQERVKYIWIFKKHF